MAAIHLKTSRLFNKHYFFIALLGFLIYFPTLFFNFTYFDDHVLILNNRFFLNNLSNILPAFKQDVFHILHGSAAYYRPILTISFILDAQLGGVNPFFYHLTNVAIHLIASCLVYLFLCRLDYRKTLSFIFALIFSVHPVLTQAVSWIPGRNDSLLTLFILASFIFLIDFINQNKWPQLVLHLLFFALALFTKETAVILMPVAVIYLLLIKKTRPTNLTILGLFWLLISVIWFLLRKNALEANPIDMNFYNSLKWILFNLPALIIYLGKLLFPVNLSVLPIWQDSVKIYGIITLVMVASLLFFSLKKKYNFIIFGLSWFLLFLLPAFIRPNTVMVADFCDHRVYLPVIGFIILLLEIDFIKNLDIKKRPNLLIVILILVILLTFTLFHMENFKNGLSFWTNAARTSPHSTLAHRNLGAMYYLGGFLNEAEAEYKKSLELNPKEQMAHNNLGLIYASRGRFKEAEEEYKKEFEVNPLYDDAIFNLGLLYYKEGKFNQAEYLWKKTIEINPDYLDAYYNLANYYNQQKNYAPAVYYLDQLKRKGVK